MTDFLRRLLPVVSYQAPDTPAEGEDERIEIDPEDDEATQDPEGEPEEDEEEEVEASDGAAPPPEPRGRRQFGELRDNNRELARQNAELTRKMSELEGRINGAQQYQQPQETPQQREARLSYLSPEERIRVELQERDQYYNNQHRQLMGQVADSGDRATFSALTTTSKVAKRFATDVERMHNEYKAKGVFVERQVILKQIIGEKILGQEGKAKPRAAANRQRQAARPAGSGSDVRVSRRPSTGSAADYETRFGDVPI
jgi:hypothetical protein